MIRAWAKGKLEPYNCKTVVAEVAITVVSTGLLMLLVEIGLSPAVAGWGRTPVIAQTQFGVRRWLARSNSPFWQQWRRFHRQKIKTTVIKQVVYLALVAVGCHYLVSYGCTLLIGLLSYHKLHSIFSGGDKADNPAF